MEQANPYLEDFQHFMALRLKASTDFVEGRFEALKIYLLKTHPPPFFHLRVFA
ncbi:hypothetical protein LWM68_27105 [Niabella sp. W65]|nr:hypothetical protein [Niabella sp. W65]MCH7366113.1 hypothetical protein [Niabella sp. W65]ULT41840.1 hypothetical protein KRR40_46010 [Niabella sp. I65]